MVDLLVVPITTTHFCRPVLEAAALGKPSILPDLKGMDEMIEDNKSGLLFKAGNPQSLAEKINFLNKNRKFVKEMGNRARLHYDAKFSRQKNINKIIQVFNDSLENGNDI